MKDLKGGFSHYMLKEIHEQPEILRRLLATHTTPTGISFNTTGLSRAELQDIEKIVFIGCGTSHHAGLVGKRLIEKLARIPVEAALASEFAYADPLVDEKTLIIAISQSGETADTIVALREAKKRGARVLALCNVGESTIAAEADAFIPTDAGPEIAIASTKAYLAMIAIIYFLAFYLAEERETLSQEEIADYLQELREIPAKAEAILAAEEDFRATAEFLKDKTDAFFLGRGLDWPLSLEGALKLKETSYIHAEAYAAGEFKHGTMALVTEGTPLIVLATQNRTLDKLTDNVVEVKKHGGLIIALCTPAKKAIADYAETVIELPQTDELLAPLVAVIPLQLLAYYTSLARGMDVDTPRNLVKSVTCE